MEAALQRDDRWARALLLVACAALVAWVQRHALFLFFSPDDLIHLQQAVGLKPIFPTPLRFLTQVLYFQIMVSLVGLNPLAFHAATLIVHLLVLLVLYFLLRAFGFARAVAILASALFGTFPLHITLIGSAVGVNDETALLFALLALLLSLKGKRLLAGAAYLVALLCKESVFFLPLLLLLSGRQGESRRAVFSRVWIHLAIAFAFGLMFLVLRQSGPAPGDSTYAASLGANVFHNLMTYTAWAVDLRQVIPDLISSYDARAWRAGIWVYLALGFFSWRIPSGRFALRFGLAWWLLGLLPVLALQFQTYRHYLYPALPGLAVAFATVVTSLVSAAARVIARSPRSHAVTTALILGALMSAYGIRAEQLIDRRLRERIPGTDLPLDPNLRRGVVAHRVLGSLHQQLPSAHANVAILSLEGIGEVFGTKSGRGNARPRQRTHDLLRESVDGGGAIRLFFPQVDSVVFLGRWTPAYRDFDLYLPYGDGFLMLAGKGSAAHEAVSRWMLENGWYRQTRDHLETVLATYPDTPSLRLAYAGSLFKLGDRSTAIAQLREVIRAAPQDSAASQARLILESLLSGESR